MMGQRFPSRRILAHQAEVNCQCYPPVLVAPGTSVTVSVNSIFKHNQVELVEMTGGCFLKLISVQPLCCLCLCQGYW